MTYAYASFDTETTGLFLKDRPDTAPGQPRLVTLSLVKSSPTWLTQSEETYLIRPENWENEDGSPMRRMPEEAFKVHGISFEYAMDLGEPVHRALDAWVACVEEGRVMCGHGTRYDIRMMRAELKRLGRPVYEDKLLSVCTMMKTVGICRLRQENGSMKTPTLEEALRHFKLPQVGAHTSIGDTLGVISLMKMLTQIGIDVTPALVPVKEWKPPKEKGSGAKKKAPVRKAPEEERPRQANWLHPFADD